MNYRKHNVEFLIIDLDAKPMVGAKACTENTSTKYMKNIQRRWPLTAEESRKICVKSMMMYSLHASVTQYQSISQCPTGHTPAKKSAISSERKGQTWIGPYEAGWVVIRQDEPFPRVNSTVTVTKDNGKIKICINPEDLNRAILKEHFTLKTIGDVFAEIDGATVFTKL